MGGAAEHERARNEAALKLLSEYLSAARCGGDGGGGGDGDDDDALGGPRAPQSTHTLPFRFVFFVPAAAETAGAPAPLRKVELTLPPPERGRGVRGALSPPARRALRRLLAACGVPEPPEGAPDDEERAGSRRRRPRPGSSSSAGGGGGDDEGEEGFFRSIAGLEPGQTLADWLPLAAEAARRGGGGGGGPVAAPPDAAVRVANLRGALRLSRGAAVGFSPALRSALPSARQAALLRALVGVLAREDAALAAAEQEDGGGGGGGGAEGLDLRGLQLTFGATNGVDGAGTVWLDASEAAAIEASVRHGEWGDDKNEAARQRHQQQRQRGAPAAAATRSELAAAEEATEAWADMLSGLDVSHARALRAAAESLHALEAGVARAMGVSAVVAGAGVAFGASAAATASAGVNPSYRAFLERLAAHAASAGPVQAPVSDVPLVVVADDDDGRGAADDDVADAAVAVALSARPADAYDALAARGPAAAERRRRRSRERAERADRDERARRALGLRRLLRDPALPADRADRGVRALLRLREDAAVAAAAAAASGGGGGGAPALAACLEGLSVRVSDACRIPGTEGTDGSSDVVDVAWNAV